MPETNVDPFTAEAPVELAPVRAGENLDWQRIEAYLRENLPSDLDLDGPFEALQFPNGAANLTYLVRLGPTELVLRRPPFGTLAPGAHDMRREYKVLSRLWRIYAAAPRAYLFCDDHTIAGADFFVMERRYGEVVRGVIPVSMGHHANVGHRLGIAFIDAVADFHMLDPADADLGDLGRPEGFVARQLAGWKKRWDLVADERFDPVMGRVHERLLSTLPLPQRISLVHNDLKLDNRMFHPDEPDRIVAFFDWDMTTLGDPMVDLGTLLNYWPDPSDTDDDRRSSHDGMARMGLPPRTDIVRRYAERTGLDVAGAPWYEAFAQWKTATVVRQLHHRWEVGDSTDERMASIADALPRLAAGAERLLDRLR